jgi:hypothetical protein
MQDSFSSDQQRGQRRLRKGKFQLLAWPLKYPALLPFGIRTGASIASGKRL